MAVRSSARAPSSTNDSSQLEIEARGSIAGTVRPGGLYNLSSLAKRLGVNALWWSHSDGLPSYAAQHRSEAPVCSSGGSSLGEKESSLSLWSLPS